MPSNIYLMQRGSVSHALGRPLAGISRSLLYSMATQGYEATKAENEAAILQLAYDYRKSRK